MNLDELLGETASSDDLVTMGSNVLNVQMFLSNPRMPHSLEEPTLESVKLKKQLASKIFGYLARCEISESILYVDPKNEKFGCEVQNLK